jgi:hypothetical protein
VNDGFRVIQHWDGSSWERIETPNPVPVSTYQLTDVACASAVDCWAIGTYYHYYPEAWGILIERWNGSAWTIVSDSYGIVDRLYDITCTSASNCWAVGSVYESNRSQALTLRWDGTSWTRVHAPPFGTEASQLSSVSCTSSSDCWAVGHREAPGDVMQTLIYHWDGNSWQSVTAPNASQRNSLSAVTCSSATECWAVGEFYQSGWPRAMIQRWNGSSWAIVPSNSGTSASHSLRDVECTSASECWAVGTAKVIDSGLPSRFVQRWDGNSWATVNLPPIGNSNGSYSEGLGAIECTSPQRCWTVGDYYPDLYYPITPVRQTLIQIFSPTSPPLARVASKRTHGSAGDFGIDLPLFGQPGIECRTSGPLGAGNYRLVFDFLNDLQSFGGASVSGGTGTVGSAAMGANPRQLVVNLTGVSNQQTLAVTLSGVVDTAGNQGSAVATMGVLFGDTNANGVVNSSDLAQVKAASGNAATADRFRMDLNSDGNVSASDISFAKSQSGAVLP